MKNNKESQSNNNNNHKQDINQSEKSKPSINKIPPPTKGKTLNFSEDRDNDNYAEF